MTQGLPSLSRQTRFRTGEGGPPVGGPAVSTEGLGMPTAIGARLPHSSWYSTQQTSAVVLVRDSEYPRNESALAARRGLRDRGSEFKKNQECDYASRTQADRHG